MRSRENNQLLTRSGSGTPMTVCGGGIYFVNSHSTMINGIKDSNAYTDIMAAMQGMRRKGTAAK
ncbi:MAG: hypothetical protein VX430_08365 [Pseudomonadota bacterium]|nr:hypothetical protein [Pseudomonadota bacterium]